jgi:sensor histidine kinase YesM
MSEEISNSVPPKNSTSKANKLLLEFLVLFVVCFFLLMATLPMLRSYNHTFVDILFSSLKMTVIALLSIKLGALLFKSLKNLSTTIKRANDDELFRIALDEVENLQTNKSLWAKSLVEANGDKDKTVACYIRMRVAQLKSVQS